MMVDNKKTDSDKYIIFESTGGHGKQILATAVIRAVKKAYPDRKIIWITSWDGPAFYNPDVFRFFLQNQIPQYFKDDYLNDDTILMKHDPYNETNHILRKEHLIETWCKMLNVPYDGYKPKIYLNPREIEIVKDKIKPDNRPIMLIQTHGGSPNQQYSKKSWYRDMPVEIAQKLINYFAKSYRILHIKSPEQPIFQGVEPLTLPYRELYAVFPLSTKRLFIDSFAQHTAAALGLLSTVVWIGNSPKVFGYPENTNILPNANVINNLDKFTYLIDDISGQVQQFPYDTVNLFDINKIIEAVNKQPVADVSKMNFIN
jgi:ADP-heptose:LPS heptosyltransferase